MSFNATLNVPNPGSGYCPAGNTYQNIAAYLNANATVTVTETSGAAAVVYSQSATPAPVAGALWFRQNADAFHPWPVEIYGVFNGRWVPFPKHRIGDVLFTTADPTGLVDGNGKGLFVPTPDTPNIAGTLFGYQQMNGLNGALGFKSRFPRVGYKYEPGTGWVASVKDDAPATTFSDQANGGYDGYTLIEQNLPPVTTRTFSSTATGSTAAVLSGINYDPAVAEVPINTSGSAQLAIQPIDPIYRVLGAYTFMGYSS